MLHEAEYRSKAWVARRGRSRSGSMMMMIGRLVIDTDYYSGLLLKGRILLLLLWLLLLQLQLLLLLLLLRYDHR